MTGAAEIRHIESALDALLNEIVKRMLAQRAEPKMPRAAQLMATPFKAIALDEIPSRHETEVNEILQDPVGSACRYAIKRLGQHLYTVAKSTDVMAEVLDRVAERDPNHLALRADIMDKWWEGIGEGEDRWWP
jgi:gamma-glutamyl-gamma-aminobutyrate hydrolase PuuD